MSLYLSSWREKILGDGWRSGQGGGQTTDPGGLGASLLLAQVCHMPMLTNVLTTLVHHYDVYLYFELILTNCDLHSTYSPASQSLSVRSGGCFVMTANLDGETNLKPLTAPKWEKFQQFGILKELLIFHLDFAFLRFEFFLSTGKLGSSSRPTASDSWKPRLQFSNKVFTDYTQYNHFKHSNYFLFKSNYICIGWFFYWDFLYF